MAQQQRIQNDTTKHVGNKKYEYLLKSLLKCGHCGRTYQATTYKGAKNKETGEIMKSRSYRCPNKNPRKYGPEVKKCEAPALNADLIEDFIWNQVLEIVTNPEKFVSRIKNKGNDSISGVREKLAVLEKQLLKKKQALEKAERSYFEAETLEDEKRYDNHRKIYKKEIAALEDEIVNYQSKIDSHRMEELTVDQIMSQVEKLRERISNSSEVPFELKRNIIEMLYDEIIITVKKPADGDTADGTELSITSVGLFDKWYQEEKIPDFVHNLKKFDNTGEDLEDLISIARSG